MGQMNSIDEITLNFSAQNIFFLNLSLAFIMFGVALNLTPKDFKLVLKSPKAVIAGFFSQFFLLPLLTYLIILVIQPYPSMALGMMMVAACPGGNISNFMSKVSQGNVALSVSLTAVSSVTAIFFTPINLAFWASLYDPTAQLLKSINMDYLGTFRTIIIILGIPIALGMIFRHKFSSLAIRIQPFMHHASLVIFAAIVIMAFSANFDLFLSKIYLVLAIVFVHNAVALISGYQVGNMLRLSEPDKRTLAIETGIQNSGLGLILIFAFFEGLGGMALVAAWWGIWHILSGLTLSFYWNKKVSLIKT